ncbi:MAG: hypothetical protein HY717_11500 [Planctomycetes bacterium]|nr:hypothetical protein [Planctomycetota bacterium]
MDKIRDNLFGIGVGASFLGFLALLYILVIYPLLAFTGGGEESTRTKLETASRDLKRFADPKLTPLLPTKDLVQSEQSYQSRLEEALKEAKAFYDDMAAGFGSFSESLAEAKASPAAFKSSYSTEIKTLREEYLKAYPKAAKPPEGEVKKEKEPEALAVDEMEEIFTEEDVARAMREFWIIQKVFAGVNTLKLGGLMAVKFPARKKEAAPPSPLYKVVESLVQIELPMAQLEPFVAELFDTTHAPAQAPLLLKSLSLYRKPESILKKRIAEKTYDKDEDAKKEDLIGGEPPVVAEITLWAMDWQGLPKEEPKPKK